jgi:hypothetical protein
VQEEQNVPRSKRFYVYAIHVNGVLRYIGKGCNGRMYAHMKEVRQRLTREFNLENVWPFFQRKLTEAVMQDAVIEEIVLADNLTSKQAYKFEYRRLEEMVYAGKRHHLWNAIPHTINTPEEREEYVSRLIQNLTSKDRWVRYLSRNQLMLLNQKKKWQVAIERQMVPGSARPPSRAAMLTPSPIRSPSFSLTTSPRSRLLSASS